MDAERPDPEQWSPPGEPTFPPHVARCQECLDLLIDYLEGELPTQRARALEIHLEMCPACWRFVQTYKGTVDVARSLPVEEIPPELIDSLISFLNREKQARFPHPRGPDD